MPTKPHTRGPGSICTAKANAGRFGYASGGLGTEAHRRSCFTPPEAASAHFAGCPKNSNVAVERPPPMIMRTVARAGGSAQPGLGLKMGMIHQAVSGPSRASLFHPRNWARELFLTE